MDGSAYVPWRYSRVVWAVTTCVLAVAGGCGQSPSVDAGGVADNGGVDSGADSLAIPSDVPRTDAVTDADGAPGDVFVPAPHAAFPQVPDQGGPRLAHPALVTVTFPGDAYRADVEAYARWLVTSSWLTTVGREYGVGAGTVLGAVQRTESPPATVASADIEHMLANGVRDGSLPRPAGGLADALYIVYYPGTTAITATFVNGITAQSCSEFGAYHGEVNDGGLRFAYAVVPECGATQSGLTVLQTMELAVSHEVIEAATDALPVSTPAYQLRPDPMSAWFSVFRFEVEVGDLCEAPAFPAREGTFVAQRNWSNAAAAAGGDPCIPLDPALPYFNTSATPDAVQHVAPGASVDFQLQGWSTAPVSSWHLSTRVRGTLAVATTVTPGVLNNGDTATLHVTVPADATPGSTAAIYLYSQRSSQNYHTWPLFIATP